MQINKEVIKELSTKNETSEALFTLWATRDRNAREGRSTLQETKRQLKKEGYLVPSEELLAIFRSLHRAGAGTLRGKVFTWDQGLGLKEVAQTALGGNGHKDVEPRNRRSTDKMEAKSQERAYKVVVAYLSDDRKVKLELPSDLSPTESKFLAGLLDGHA